MTQDTTVLLSVDYAGSTAERDLDYASLFSPDPHLVIPAGSTRGTRLFIVQPVVDGQPEGDETIRLIGTASGLVVQGAEITLSEQAPTTTTTTEPTTTPTEPATSSSGATADQEYTVGVSIPPLVLKAVAGGTYGVSGLPEGLSFDPDTRTISGTPTKATNGPVTVTVALIDAAGQVTTTTFTIKVSTSAGSSDSSLGFTATIANQVYTVGSSIPSLVLPVATGGTGTLSYGISGLPEGLSFDRTTRTISGTPTAETNGSVTVTYTAIDEAGNTAVTTFSITVNPGLDLGGFFDLFGKAVALPTEFVLADNSPNPFNPQTMIRYALPQAADVELTVYNVVGQPVRTLVAQHQHAGLYAVEWDATDDRGHRLSSGVYLYRLQAGEFREVKKMLLLK